MKLQIILLISIFGIFLFGCTENQNQSMAERIKGEWVVVKAEGEFSDMNLDTHFEFDGLKLTTSKEGVAVSGSYELKSDSITWKLENMEMNYLVGFEGDKLLISLPSSGQKLYLEKH